MYLITGGSGFLGRVLLEELGGSVQTLGRSGATYCADLATETPELKGGFDIVVHAAGKAHSVPRTQAEAKAFFEVNLEGTKNLARGLERSSALPRAIIFISTVAVYGLESGANITEAHPLQGTSPYALSKIQAEAFLQTWGQHTGVRIGILRLPLVVGPNPPGNLGAMIEGIKTGRYLRIGRGETRKSVVLAADLPQVFPKLAEKGGVFNLSDGHHPSFAELEATICQRLGKPLPRALPLSVAKALGKLGDLAGGRAPVTSAKVQKLTSELTFDDAKARNILGWRPRRAVDYLLV